MSTDNVLTIYRTGVRCAADGRSAIAFVGRQVDRKMKPIGKQY